MSLNPWMYTASAVHASSPKRLRPARETQLPWGHDHRHPQMACSLRSGVEAAPSSSAWAGSVSTPNLERPAVRATALVRASSRLARLQWRPSHSPDRRSSRRISRSPSSGSARPGRPRSNHAAGRRSAGRSGANSSAATNAAARSLERAWSGHDWSGTRGVDAVVTAWRLQLHDLQLAPRATRVRLFSSEVERPCLRAIRGIEDWRETPFGPHGARRCTQARLGGAWRGRRLPGSTLLASAAAPALLSTIGATSNHPKMPWFRGVCRPQPRRPKVPSEEPHPSDDRTNPSPVRSVRASGDLRGAGSAAS